MAATLRQRALEAFKRSVHDPEGFFLTGLSQACEGLWEPAVESYDVALRSCQSRRVELEKQGEESEPTWDDVLDMCGELEWELYQIDQLETKTTVQLARSYDGLGQAARAQETLEKAVDLNPESVYLRCYLALLYQERGMPAEARAQCEAALEYRDDCSEEEEAMLVEVCATAGLSNGAG